MRPINWGQSLLIAVLVTAVPLCLLSIIAIIAPAWPWLIITALCFLAALEAMGTTVWLHHRERLILNQPLYRAAEFMVIAIFTRLFTWAITDGWPQASQWRSYLIEPSILLDGHYVISLLLLLLAWGWAIALTGIFYELEISKAESKYYDRTQSSGDRPIALNRIELVQRFFQQWIWGGIFIAFCAALTTFNLPEIREVRNPLSIGRLGLRPEVLVASLLYFLSGLWLLSQARLSVMKARWLTGRVVKQDPVEQNWRRSSFTTLLIIAVLAALLPIGSTLGISRILNTLIFSLIFLLNFLVLLASALFVGLLSLFGRSPPPEASTDTETFSPNFQFLGEGLPPPDTPSLIAGSIFWLVVGLIATAAFIFFLRERGYRPPSWRQLWRSLRRWLHQLWFGITTQVEKLQLARQERPKESKRPLRTPWRFLRLNALSPREQIRYFYLSTVRRATEKGVARHQSDTPLEYADELRQAWPDTTADVTDLTTAFLQAQYSPEPIETQEATAVKSVWKRIRAAVRKHKGN
jgi:hypothetical protein